jgi:hypothetical protein
MSTATLVREEKEIKSSVAPSEGPPLSRIERGQDEDVYDTRDDFDDLADELEGAAAGLSSTRRAMAHPAFAEILALGDPAISASLNRLKVSSNRPLWLRVLGTLTASPPGVGQSTIDDAANAWIRWGSQKRFAA